METQIKRRWMKPNEIPREFKSLNQCLLFLGAPRELIYADCNNPKGLGTIRNRYDEWTLKFMVDSYYSSFLWNNHPDHGGTDEMMALGNMAKERAYHFLGEK